MSLEICLGSGFIPPGLLFDWLALFSLVFLYRLHSFLHYSLASLEDLAMSHTIGPSSLP